MSARFQLRTQPVTAIQWSGHADENPLVRRLGTEFDTRLPEDRRDVGICMTHYGRKHILSGDWIITTETGAVDVVPSYAFPRLYEPCAEA